MAVEGSEWKRALERNRPEIIERLSDENDAKLLDRVFHLLVQTGCIAAQVNDEFAEKSSSSRERCRLLLDSCLQTKQAFDVFCQALRESGLCADLARKLTTDHGMLRNGFRRNGFALLG